MKRWGAILLLAAACTGRSVASETPSPIVVADEEPAAPSAEVAPASAPAAAPAPDPVRTAWPPILKDGDRLYFVGNSYMGNHGGLPRALEKLLAQREPPLSVQSDGSIFFGKGLGEMHRPDVAASLSSGVFSVCVITSGKLDAMRRFANALGGCERSVVFLTWPINPVVAGKRDLAQYQADLSAMVADVRAFEREAGASVIPAGIAHEMLLREPPPEAKRLDWIYWERNIHQNGVGMLVNVYTAYAGLLHESPEGLSFDFVAPYQGDIFVGQRIATRQTKGDKLHYDEVVLTDELRSTLQKVAWKAVVDWRNGTTKFD